MPEGPEVAKIRDFLYDYLYERKITKIQFENYKPLEGVKINPDASIQEIERKGKCLFFKFNNGDVMYHHLNMSGWWYENKDEAPHLRATFFLDTGEKLYFSATRKWAKFEIISKKKEEEIKNSLGLDVLSESINFDDFYTVLKKHSNKTLDVLLMKQEILCSIGNYLKAEILFACKIHPKRKIKDLSEDDWLILYENCVKIPKEAYDFKDRYYPKVVYNQKKCPHDHTVKTYKSSDGRTTHWCSECQT